MAQTNGAHDFSHNSDGYFVDDGQVYDSRIHYLDPMFGAMEKSIRAAVESMMASAYQHQPHASGASPPRLEASTSPSSAENTSASQQQSAEESTGHEEELEEEVEEVDNRPIKVRGRGRGFTGNNKGRPPGSKNKPKVPDDGLPKVPKKRGRPPGAKNKPKGYYRELSPPPPRDDDSPVVGRNDTRTISGRVTKRAVKKAPATNTAAPATNTAAPATNTAAPVTNTAGPAIDPASLMAALMEDDSVPPAQQAVDPTYMPADFSEDLFPPRPGLATAMDSTMAPPPRPVTNYSPYLPLPPPPWPPTNFCPDPPLPSRPRPTTNSYPDPTLAALSSTQSPYYFDPFSMVNWSPSPEPSSDPKWIPR